MRASALSYGEEQVANPRPQKIQQISQQLRINSKMMQDLTALEEPQRAANANANDSDLRSIFNDFKTYIETTNKDIGKQAALERAFQQVMEQNPRKKRQDIGKLSENRILARGAARQAEADAASEESEEQHKEKLNAIIESAVQNLEQEVNALLDIDESELTRSFTSYQLGREPKISRRKLGREPTRSLSRTDSEAARVDDWALASDPPSARSKGKAKL